MIDAILTTLQLAKTFAYFWLALSWKTGETIINIFHYLISGATVFSKQVVDITKVLAEDFNVFLFDLCYRVAYVSRGVILTLETFENLLFSFIIGIKDTFVIVSNGVIKIYSVIGSGIQTMASATIELFVFVKRLIVLFGLGVWFLITFIPLTLLSFYKSTVYYLGQIDEEIKHTTLSVFLSVTNTITDICKFITDVPVESVFGIFAGICILYMVFTFHMALQRFLCLKIMQFYELVRANVHTVTRNRVQRVVVESSSEAAVESDDSDESLERYCVICQDRDKCILLLPCKHLCLCSECNSRLRNYNRQCPICRSRVQKTMKIFV